MEECVWTKGDKPPAIFKLYPPDGKGYIYMYEFENGKKYVGQTVCSVAKRHYSHYKRTHVDNMIKSKRYILKIIDICDESRLSDMEEYYIIKYSSLYPNGYNHAARSEGGGSRPLHRGAKAYTARSVIFLAPDNNFYEYDSIIDSIRDFGLNESDASSISNCLKGIRPNVKGLVFWYRDENGCAIDHVCKPKKRGNPVVITDCVGNERQFSSVNEALRTLGIKINGASFRKTKNSIEHNNKIAYGYFWRQA